MATEVRIWSSNSGREYVTDYVRSLNAREQKIILEELDMFAQFGYNVAIKTGLIKPLQGHSARSVKLHEIVIKSKSVSYRIFCVMRDSICWLVHIIKKTEQ